MSESHLLQTYQSKVVPLLQEKYKYKNKHQIPRIKKVTLNMGLGEAIQNPKAIETASKQLAAIYQGRNPSLQGQNIQLPHSSFVKVCP